MVNLKSTRSQNLFEKIYIFTIVSIVRVIVNIYTWLTLPIYFLLQRPWIRIEKARNVGARLVNQKKERHPIDDDAIPLSLQNTEFLEYERFVPIPPHPLMKCNTIIEAIYERTEIYPNDEPVLGFREIIEEQIQLNSNGQPIRIDGKVLRKYKLSDYKWITYNQFLEQFESCARGLLSLGIKRNTPIAIYSETSLQFTISSMASAKCGALLVTVFHTLTDEGLIHALNETECQLIFVSFELLNRVLGFHQKCPKLKTIIYFEGPNKKEQFNMNSQIDIYTLDYVQNLGKKVENLNLKSEPLKCDDLFCIMYTSGTTGIPKGVKITQSQVKEAAMAIGQVVRDVIMTGPEHIYISYLPQAHIMEFTLQTFLFLGGVKVGYSSPFTLNESAPGLVAGQKCDLQLLKPTIMTTVPLVLDRMQKEIYCKLEKRFKFSKKLFEFLIDYKSYWITKGYTTPIVDLLLCRKIQKQFGGHLTYMVVGSAPLSSHLQKQIKCSLNVTLVQGYGSTESSGGIVAMDFHDLSYGRVGSPLNGVRLRLIDWIDGDYSLNDKPNPRGELILGGKMISNGYLNRNDLNRETFFNHNQLHWFITGDIAEVFPDGTFKIIDRKKDIVKLSNGKFISLGRIESILKSSVFIDNICCIVNTNLNCLIALVLPNQTNLKKLLKNLKTSQLIHDTIYDDILMTGINQGLKPIELPCLIHIVMNEIWSPDNDLLTAAMKLRRNQIHKYYKKEIDLMFQNLESNPSKKRIARHQYASNHVTELNGKA